MQFSESWYKFLPSSPNLESVLFITNDFLTDFDIIHILNECVLFSQLMWSFPKNSCPFESCLICVLVNSICCLPLQIKSFAVIHCDAAETFRVAHDQCGMNTWNQSMSTQSCYTFHLIWLWTWDWKLPNIAPCFKPQLIWKLYNDFQGGIQDLIFIFRNLCHYLYTIRFELTSVFLST